MGHRSRGHVVPDMSCGKSCCGIFQLRSVPRSRRVKARTPEVNLSCPNQEAMHHRISHFKFHHFGRLLKKAKEKAQSPNSRRKSWPSRSKGQASPDLSLWNLALRRIEKSYTLERPKARTLEVIVSRQSPQHEAGSIQERHVATKMGLSQIIDHDQINGSCVFGVSNLREE
jgi:hypothetical protein